jgi:predicted dehydrogenase
MTLMSNDFHSLPHPEQASSTSPAKPQPANRISRRSVLRGTGAAVAVGAGMSIMASATAQERSGDSEQSDHVEPLRLAIIGVANRGQANLDGVASQNIVALCDVDAGYLEEASKRFPEAAKFQDYRKLLDEVKELDGVVISTPDHHHAPAAMMAIERGLHVYCEKPLTHTVAEARALTEAARKAGVATQMGTQIHAGSNYRRVVELIRSGVIGKIEKVHVWVGKGWGATEMPQPTGETPESLDWNVWLGPAEERPYTPNLHPANWRRYRDFGTGTLGDMGCHYMDLPFWALGLGAPKEIVAEGPQPDPECCPLGLSVKYQFAASDTHGDLQLTWYDGDLSPKELEGMPVPGSGVLFVGDNGKMFADYSSYRLFPEQQFVDFQPPEPTIPDSIGHYEEWFRACRGGEKSLCNFDYSGPLTECVLLGTVAHRVGRPLQWNRDELRCVGDDEATALISKTNRDGWVI